MRYQKLLCLSVLLLNFHARAQDVAPIQWMTFEEMETAFAENPKPVFVDFWATWCHQCLRMDRYAFSNAEILERLRTDYYAVKMDAETRDTIYFGGKRFVNQGLPDDKEFHQLALLLGSDVKGQFVLPTTLIFDRDFQLISQNRRYLSSKQMLAILVEHAR